MAADEKTNGEKPKFSPKIVAKLPEKKKRGKSTEYSTVIEFVENAGGEWVLVAEKKSAGSAHASVKRWRDEAGKEFEAVVRGNCVYIRLIVSDDDDTDKGEQSSEGTNPDF